MRKIQIILILLLFTGCGLLPKKVEYFQKEVKEMPAPDSTHLERQKQAAEFVARKSSETLTQAIKDNSSTNVLIPIRETEIVADSLSGSLGKPLARWYKVGYDLAEKLDIEDAKLDRDLEKFRDRNDAMQGKNVEGTGAIQLPYFTNILIFAAIFFVLYVVVKVFSVLNPGVSVGTKVLGGGLRGLIGITGRGLSEVLKGGETFKKMVDEKIEDEKTRNMVKELFVTAHKQEQSSDVQKVVKDLIS